MRPPNAVEPDRATIERAAIWHALLRDTDMTDSERQACTSWRAEHAAHELAWQRMCQLWGEFEPARADVARNALNAGLATVKRRHQRRRRIAVAVFLLAIGAGAVLQQRGGFADYRAGSAPQTFALVDGSRITLDSGAAADVTYDGSQRRIDLRRGEILVDVARDPQRPFSVHTSQGSARALGTRFLVNKQEQSESTRVTVLESHVRVCAESGGVPCVELQPGEQVDVGADHFGAGHVDAIRRVDAEATSAWVQRRLAVDNVPMVEVLAALQRHRTGRIYFDAEKLAGVRVSGLFPLDDTDKALAVLAATLPVQVEHYTALLVTVTPR